MKEQRAPQLRLRFPIPFEDPELPQYLEKVESPCKQENLKCNSTSSGGGGTIVDVDLYMEAWSKLPAWQFGQKVDHRPPTTRSRDTAASILDSPLPTPTGRPCVRLSAPSKTQ
jgi:hypothetical protein